MGCAIFFVAMINHPELNDKIEVMMALAPATALDHMRSPIRYFAPFVTALQVCTVIIISIFTTMHPSANICVIVSFRVYDRYS